MEGIERFLSESFQAIINLSLVGSYVILLIILVRLVLRKAPCWCSYALWGIVFLRLICPVFPEAGFSLIPSQLENNLLTEWSEWDNSITAEITSDENVVIDNHIMANAGTEALMGATLNADNHQVEGTITGQLQEQTSQSVDLQGKDNLSIQNMEAQEGVMQKSLNVANGTGSAVTDIDVFGKLVSICSFVWLFGAILLGGYHTFSYWRLKIKVKNAVVTESGVREIQGEHLSFVMGIFKPTIYLSEGLDEESRRVVLCHESVHLQRRDYLFKPAALAICCLHWFNPLVWLAFHLMNKDCEMSCDEKVVRLLGEESKKVYSYALLDEATRGERKYYRKGTVCALLSFGEDSVKRRISHVLHYKKASLWIVIGAVILLVVLFIGLLSNPGSEPMTMERAREIVVSEGGYPEDSYTHGFLGHYDEDDRQEIFVEIGEKEADGNRIKGDLWFVSRDGDAELLLQNKSLYIESENFIADNKLFLLVSYVEDDTLRTTVYGVRDGEAVPMTGRQDEKYVDGESIVALCTDSMLEYDMREQSFSGYDQKKYTYYYDGYYLKPHKGYGITREEVEAYENGGEILKSLEETYADARFEYILRENGWLHINIAYRELDTIKFHYVTYDSRDNRLKELEEGPGCYRADILAEGGVAFAEQVAMEYGWQSDSTLVTSQLSAEMALDRFAWAFADRDGDALYQLSSDKENFENWNKVIPLEDGSYAFGDSSPWVTPGNYQIEYTEGEDEATIRFIMSNSAPEHYIAKESVKLVKEGELYFVDHVDYKMYSEIESRQELAEIFDLESKNPLSSSLGEGSVVNVRYTFDKDGSTVDIPMVLAEESENIWVLSTGDLSQADAQEEGPPLPSYLKCDTIKVC